MSHVFVVEVANVAATLEKVKSEMLAAGYEFSSDSTSGKFSGKGVKGNFVIAGNAVSITLTAKPFMVTYKFVEGKVREYFMASAQKSR